MPALPGRPVGDLILARDLGSWRWRTVGWRACFNLRCQSVLAFSAARSARCRRGRRVELTDLRKYARRTAAELASRGIQPVHLVEASTVHRTVERVEGWLFKRTVKESVVEQRDAVHPGWPLWTHDVTVVEWKRAPNVMGGGWTIEKSIWLDPSGELMAFAMQRSHWQPGQALPDSVSEARVALDTDITFADLPLHAYPRSPSPPRKASGLFESHVGIRRGDRLPPGMRISRALTDLRKRHGTYVARRPSSDRK